jgi:Mrp family chromosome partitioning ATPase
MSCDHNCGSCTKKGSCTKLKANESNIKHIIAIMSGKGGVGKSSVTSMLASTYAKKGFKVGILDADITGPSITKAFGVHGRITASNNLMNPIKDKNGIEMVSVNLILDDESKPVVWRGPILTSAVSQFFENVRWNDLDYLFVDMPPGTSDIALTVFNQIPIDGVIMVTSPQDLVTLIVEKAINLATLTKTNILGVIENFSYFKCPCCNEITYIYGKSHLDEVLKQYNLKSLGHLPLDQNVCRLMDLGEIYNYESNELEEIYKKLN